ncbi:MAG: hypothetical protein FWC77_03040 [Defluviitaleaceae bacterium]|nr:hypothetical protein [Defluviitaleaceae bacterium]
MKNRGEINLALAKNVVMNRVGNNEYYTPAQVKSEGLHNCMIEPSSILQPIKNLVNNFKGWRGKNEHTTYIEVCE